MPRLLPWALVPSPNLCFSTGFPGHPQCLWRVPALEEAQLRGQDRADTPDRTVLGEDNPQSPGLAGRGLQPCHGEGCANLHRCPAPAPLLQLHPPSLASSTQPPRALRQETPAHLGPGSGTEGSQHPQTPLPAIVSGPQPHGAPGWETGVTGRERGAGRRDWSGRLRRDRTSPVPLCSLR